MRFRAVRAAMWVVCLSGGLSGCASSTKQLADLDVPAVVELSGLAGDAVGAESRKDGPLAALMRQARDNPADKEPWLKLARLHFNDTDYGKAIVAAEEVLLRDPADRTAKSLRAVSGLRVATQSLADLRSDADLRGSAEADAKSLAGVLRETLGEAVLVPAAPVAREDAGASKPRPKPRAPAPARSAPPVSGDPFSVLK